MARRHTKLVQLILSLMAFLWSYSSQASPASLNYQGRIVTSAGTALTYSSVSFIFKILDPGGTCIIYQEQVNGIDMTGSNGVFDVPIGTGSVTYPTDGSVTILDAFNNGGVAFNCSGGTSTYTSASGDIRRLRVMFYDGTGWSTITPDNQIRSVPFAAYSYSAEKLGNYSYNAFVLKTGLPTCTAGTFLSFDGSSFTCAAVSGASGGTVTSITAGTGLSGGTITSSGTIALSTSGVTSGSYGSATQVPVMTVDTYGRVTSVTSTTISGVAPGGAASGDLSGSYPSPTVSGLNGTSLSIASLASGNFLKYNGTSWTNVTPTTSDISGLSTTLSSYLTTSAFNGYVAGASGVNACSSSQTMYWNSVSNAFACSTISGVALSGDVTGTTSASVVSKLAGTSLAIASLASGQYLKYNGTNWVNSDATVDATNITYSSQTANTFFAAPNGSAGTPSFRSIVAADLPTVPYTRGGTGLTTAPANGQLLIGNGTGYAIGNLTAGSNITITNAAGAITIAASSSGGTVTGVTGSAPISVSASSTSPVVSISQASSSTDGYLSSTDWSTFNSKLNATLADGKIFVGNSSSTATAVSVSGDATLADTGALTLANSGVTAGTYPKVTVNAKGLVTAGSSLTLTDFPSIANGTVLANVSGSAATPSATTLSSLLDSVTTTQGSILYRNSSGWTYLSPGTSGQYLQTQGTSANPQWATVASSGGTVTNVGLSLPTIFSVTNSPITSSGTLTATLASETANTVFAGPSGSAGTPTFRSLVSADLPTSGVTAGTYKSVTVDIYGRVTAATNPTTVAGYGITDAFVNGGNSFGAAANLGTNDAYALNLQTSGSTRMTVSSAGNVGIGTSSPSYLLDVAGITAIGTGARLSMAGNSFAFNRDASNGNIYSSSQYAYQFQHTGSTTAASDYLALQVYSPTGTTVSSSALAVNGQGYVGIGTTSPSSLLHISDVYGNSESKLMLTHYYASGTTANGYMRSWGTSSGTASTSFGSLAAGDVMTINNGTGYLGVGTTTPAVRLDVHASLSSTTSTSVPIAMFTNDYNSGTGNALSIDVAEGAGLTNLVAGASINSTGNGYNYIGARGAARILMNDGAIGLYTGNASTGTAGSAVTWTNGGVPVIYTDYSGNVSIKYGSSTTYGLYVAGSVAGTSAYVNASDRRLKKDIQTIPDALAKIDQLRGVTYNWRKDEYPKLNLGDRQELGVIAQEIEQVFPQAVSKEETTGIKSVAYSMLVAPLIEAVKELHQMFIAHDNEIKDLKSENAEMKAWICAKDSSAPFCGKSAANPSN